MTSTEMTAAERRFWAHFVPMPRGINVWILLDGETVTTVDPGVDPDTGARLWSYEFLGGHSHVVSDEVAAILGAAGFGVTTYFLDTEGGDQLITENGNSLVAEGMY